jgi:hypothetical protein
MAQNSARNMPMAETWHRLGVMFHKLKQTDNTSLLAKTWTVVKHLRLGNNLGGGASPVALSIWARQDISRIQVLVTYFFPTPPIKLKLGMQIGERRLVVTHWINQKQGEINKYDLTVVFFSSFRAPSESCAFCQGRCSRHPVDLTAVPHPRFLVQGHILSAPGDSVNLKHRTCYCNPTLVVSGEL